ncbi:unnamed protein product [Adineta ricciae]|uniref:F-box domain-containing protein n=1 Tax=Adineta ricciae TaxID=249248 RepID=A0A815J5E1_ADIRI|nr:unnamed protein product [Adineta ricciae]
MEEQQSKPVIFDLSWSLDESRQTLSSSLFRDIPNEILLHIFRFLSVPDLCRISSVCRAFKILADRDELWKVKCDTSKKLYSKSYKQIYIEWIHEKSIRNQKLNQIRMERMHRTACIICLPPSYPQRPAGKHHFQSIGSFKQHPNSTRNMAIPLSVDIDETAPKLISLSEKTGAFLKQWFSPSVLKQMIQRYYRFMQLKAYHPTNTLLIPTLDIEIIWQTHLLRPEMYEKDCIRLFRRVIDHSLVLNEVESYFKRQAFIDTCQLYEEKFGEKYCTLPKIEEEKNDIRVRDLHAFNSRKKQQETYSYWDETQFEFLSKSPQDYENPFSFTEGDIKLDGEWFELCKQFMFDAFKKLSTPIRHYYSSEHIDLGPNALRRLKKSYERFLYMAAKYPLKDGNGFIPPTYAVDIIWHSHMQEPLKYIADCVRLVGYVIYHDPWPIVEDEKMKKSCDKVDQIWRDEFQCELGTDHLYDTSNNNKNSLAEDYWDTSSDDEMDLE